MMKSRKKEFKRKYFGSLTHQLILISICLVTGTLLLCWFINTVFLEPYYVIAILFIVTNNAKYMFLQAIVFLFIYATSFIGHILYK